MNHTDAFNYWPFQYALHRAAERYTAAWVKGKNYDGFVASRFMRWTNNIPLASRGYVITRDFVSTVGRLPSADEYRVLRRRCGRCGAHRGQRAEGAAHARARHAGALVRRVARDLPGGRHGAHERADGALRGAEPPRPRAPRAGRAGLPAGLALAAAVTRAHRARAGRAAPGCHHRARGVQRLRRGLRLALGDREAGSHHLPGGQADPRRALGLDRPQGAVRSLLARGGDASTAAPSRPWWTRSWSASTSWWTSPTASRTTAAATERPAAHASSDGPRGIRCSGRGRGHDRGNDRRGIRQAPWRSPQSNRHRRCPGSLSGGSAREPPQGSRAPGTRSSETC
jgi:hypothetical protein